MSRDFLWCDHCRKLRPFDIVVVPIPEEMEIWLDKGYDAAPCATAHKLEYRCCICCNEKIKNKK